MTDRGGLHGWDPGWSIDYHALSPSRSASFPLCLLFLALLGSLLSPDPWPAPAPPVWAVPPGLARAPRERCEARVETRKKEMIKY